MLNLYIAYRQPGQTSTAEVAKRDLRAELLAAEAEAREKKRKAEGPIPPTLQYVPELLPLCVEMVSYLLS